jgi:protein ImuA
MLKPHPALAELRHRIRFLENPDVREGDVLPFGVEVIDALLPAGGLQAGALHEAFGAAEEGFAPEPTLFVAGILARQRRPVLWCMERRDLFAPGLASVGLHPENVIYAEATRANDVLLLMEEGLRHASLGGVVGEIGQLSLTASRRLQLSAEKSGVPAFALRRWFAREGKLCEPTAAATRWQVTALPSTPLRMPGIGRARWRLDLLRCRGGEPASWIMEACDAQGRLAVPSHVADRPAAAEGRRLAA